MMTFEITEEHITAATEASGSCPPEDTYLAEIVEAPNPEWKPGYQGVGEELSNKISFRIMDYDWDYPITGFFTWQRKSKDGKLSMTMLNESSKSNALLVAATGQLPYAGMKFSMNDLLHKRVKILIKPKANGYPNIEKILPLSARDEAKVQSAPDAPASEAASKPVPESGTSMVSRRTLKKINDLAAEKGYTPDLLNGLSEREFGVPFDHLTPEEVNEFLEVLEGAEPVAF